MYEFGVLIVLGTAVLHIRPVEILSDPKSNRDAFGLSLALAISGVLGWGRTIELYIKGVGQPAIKNTAKRDIFWSMPTTLLYIAAAFVAGFEFFGNQKSTTNNSYSMSDDHGYEADLGNLTVDEDHRRSRVLATIEESSSYETYENNVPIYLLLAGSLWYMVNMAVMVLVLPGGGKHKEYVVSV
jgi:hypothetical protein